VKENNAVAGLAWLKGGLFSPDDHTPGRFGSGYRLLYEPDGNSGWTEPSME
jgi:hypothetical protein